MDQTYDLGEQTSARQGGTSPPGTRTGRLFVASNRVMQRGETQVGGLAQAMLTPGATA